VRRNPPSLRLAALSAGLLLGAAAWGQAKTEGEESNGPVKALPTLEDRIPPVSGNLGSNKGRFEIAVGLGASFADPFFNKLQGGLYLGYHFLDTLSVQLHVAGGVNWMSGYAVTCTATSCTGPTSGQLSNAPGDIPFLGSLGLSWAPVYGKLNLFAETVLHFDAYISLGFALIDDTNNSNGFSPGAVVSLGQRYMLNQNHTVALRLEVSDYMYSYSIAAMKESWFAHQFLFDLGVDFLL
jgi:outer membrane beta-barrel protein